MQHAFALAVRALFALLALFLALVNFWLTPQQANTIGFAARNRDPNELALVLSIVATLVGAALAIWIALRPKPRYQVPALIGLVVLTIYTYYASW